MLAELLIVLLLSTLAATFSLRQAVKDAETLSAKALGEQTSLLAQGLENYIFNNYAALSVGDPINGFPTPLTPTYQQLLEGKYIDLNIGNKSIFGQNFVYKVETANCPGLNCNVFGYVYTDKAVLQADGTTINEGITITALQTIGFRGGVTYTDAPNIIRGLGGAAKATVNPIPGPAGAGLVFAFAGSSASPFNAFYKKAGDTLLGPMEGNNQAIKSVKTVSATESFTAPQYLDADNAALKLDPSGDSIITNLTLQDAIVSKRSPTVKLSSLLGKSVPQSAGSGPSPANIAKPVCTDNGTASLDIGQVSALSPDGAQAQILASASQWTVTVTRADGSTPIPGARFSYRVYCDY